MFASFALLASVAPVHLRAQDEDTSKPEQHGRKYKAPPVTSHIEVTVLKGFNKKPIDGAHVVFNPTKDGVEEGSLEVKTHPDGKAVIDVIPTGSKVRIQVIAGGFATFADDYLVSEPAREITIAMKRPQAQISTYVDNQGKPAQMQPGVQEPIRPKKAAPATVPAGSPAAPVTPPPPASTPPDSSPGSGSKPQS